MTEEERSALLTMLRNSLEIITEYMDDDSKQAKNEELGNYIDASIGFIEREGITLDFSALDDMMLITMYSAWLYEKRKDPSAVMPRMIRYNLNNRLIQEKINEG